MSPQGTLLLTGANGGIATGFISQFLESPYAAQYKGYYTVRDPATVSNLQHVLEAHDHDLTPHDFEIAPLDMSTLESTRKAAKSINKRVSKGTLPPIRALVLNAGVQDATLNFTPDGLERVFSINYLHNFVLVLLLLQSMDKEHGRIILIGTTSIFPDWLPNRSHYATEEQKTFFTTVDELARGTQSIDKEFHSAQRRYAMSKVLMIMFMHELQRRLDSDPALSKISFLGLDPGWVTTSIGRYNPMAVVFVMWTFQYLAPLLGYFWPNHFVRTAAKTGDDLVRVCFDDKKYGEFPKALYVDGSEVGATMNQEALDVGKQKALWEGSVRYAGIKEGDTVLADWK